MENLLQNFASGLWIVIGIQALVWLKHWNKKFSDLYDELKEEVVEVVRCKDCKHSYDDISGLCCSHGVCVDCNVPEGFYCSYGERKDVDNAKG